MRSVWRLDSRRTVVCGGWDENHKGGPMLRGLQRIVGERVSKVELREAGLDLSLTFGEDLVLHIFCDQVNEVDMGDNYSFFAPPRIYTVGTRSRLRLEPAKPPSRPAP